MIRTSDVVRILEADGTAVFDAPHTEKFYPCRVNAVDENIFFVTTTPEAEATNFVPSRDDWTLSRGSQATRHAVHIIEMEYKFNCRRPS